MGFKNLRHVQGFPSKDLRNVAGVQLAAGVSVALVLSLAFDGIDPEAFRYVEFLNLSLHLSFLLKCINSLWIVVRVVESFT